MHRATLAAVVAARYFTFRSSLFLYLVQISSRRSSQSVFCAPYFIVVCNTLEVGGVKHNKVHIGLLTLFSSESNLPAFFSIRLVSSRFLADLDPAGYLDRLSALGDLAKTSGRVNVFAPFCYEVPPYFLGRLVRSHKAGESLFIRLAQAHTSDLSVFLYCRLSTCERLQAQ